MIRSPIRPLLFKSLLLVILGTRFEISSPAQPAGEEIFKTSCIACHSIGSGKLVGPDLKDVQTRRDHSWLTTFIKSPNAMIQKKDPVAVSLLAEFNNILMPDQPLTDVQINDVLAYIAKQSASAQQTPLTPFEDEIVATKEDIRLGENLFQGKVRLEHGGPSCISCHNVVNDAVIGGGILAKELTDVFSKLGGTGVRAILGSPPFPVMQQAYKDKPLTEHEQHAVIAFLKDTDVKKLYQKPRDYGTGLAVSGAAGVLLLMGFYSVIWFRRKKASVNQSIYDRQVKSESDDSDFVS